MVMENKQVANSSIPIIFGCSNFVFGNLAANKHIDGILGLSIGSGLSVFSQLSSAGVSPMVFSHCLGSTQEDSASLFFEAADEPGVTYTHMYPFESRYNLYLRSIVVNGQPLPIDPLTFEISKTTDVVIDSGTPLVYIPEEVHRPFVNALCSSIRPSQMNPIIIHSNQCFETNNSVYEEFPVVTINFVDASMELNPLNYLELYETIDTKSIWCIAWLKWQGGNKADGLTILADIITKDKIIMYDLINHRLGWKNYDCSLPINISTNTIIVNATINSKHSGQKASREREYAIVAGVLALVVIVITVMVIYRFTD